MDFSSLKVSELGKLVLSSGLLHSSWSKISEIHDRPYRNKDLVIKIFTEARLTFVVFAAPPTWRNDSAPTPLSRSQDPNPFRFLFSEKISSFSVHTPAFKLFSSACNQNLGDLKSELLKLLEAKKPVIITGAALGGSVASLFTLWLLESIDPKLKRPSPLCITFGSPLIGNASLQEILENSTRNSWFLHVTDAAQPLITGGLFKPFGTFLICYDSECICIEDPEAVTELLTCVTTNLVEWRDYGEILQRLDQSSMADSELMIDDVIRKMYERTVKKMVRYVKLEKLNEMKIFMAYMKWYKKKSKMEKIGYYDEFKIKPVFPYENERKELNSYWDSMVEEVEKKPQSDKSFPKPGVSSPVTITEGCSNHSKLPI